MSFLFVLAASYLLGSVPNGLIFGKLLWQTDLRKYGSRNIGATNAWRVLGKGPGVFIFLLDFLKGYLSVRLAMVILGTPLSMVLAGILAIVGHSCSLFLGFKGGKGVATGLGVISMLMPDITVIVFAVWLFIVYRTRYVSLGSIVAAVLVPVLAILFSYPAVYIAFGLLAALFITVRHRANIERLRNGTENKV